MESLSLSKLNLYIRRVVTLNFQEPIWVSAELLSLKEKNGHVYLDLTEKDEADNIAAQNSAIIWKTTFTTIKKTSSFDVGHILRVGNEVRLLVLVDYSVKYGLKLIVQSIDAEFTYGRIAQSRLRTIEALKQAELWQRNKNCILPVAIKNIAVIASMGSAGFSDFENQLKDNEFKYFFNISVFNVTVQGINSVPEICNAIKTSRTSKSKFDIIVIIRGGGSKLDLLDFDSFEIAKEISISDIPIITGIGHFIDESIADLSAFQSLKTPTAAADFIIQINRVYEISVHKLMDFIIQMSKQLFSNSIFGITQLSNDIYSKAKLASYDSNINLAELRYKINRMTVNFYYEEIEKLADLNIIILSNDPEYILQKGYSLTYKDDDLILKSTTLKIGDKIKTVYSKGVLTSKIDDLWEQKN